MKTKLGNPLTTDIGYPYTGIKDTGCIVLFHAPQKGICVYADNNFEVGEYRTDWMEQTQFRRTKNQIILENE